MSTNRKITKSKFSTYLARVERNFKTLTDINEDISVYPLHHHLDTSTETDKSKSKQFGEVFTPLWLVDEMVEQTTVNEKSTVIDLCAGYGQFTIRLLRKLCNKNPQLDYVAYMRNKHSFVELQLGSCYKLCRLFGKSINLFIGDATKLHKLPGVATGVWCYIESMNGWVDLSHTFKDTIEISKTFCVEEEVFVDAFQSIISNINDAYKKNMELVMEKISISHSSDRRLHALEIINRSLNDIYPKDKDITTPTSVVNMLLAQVNDLDKKKILVLFNAEIVEELIHKYKVSKEDIIFSVDKVHEARGRFVNKMYGVETCEFASKEPKSIIEALGGKKWDLVLSNPPYNRGLDLKILQTLMGKGTVDSSIAKEFVWVHPSTWLLDQKGKTNLYGNIKASLNNKLRSVSLFNGNAVFGIEIFVPCVITHIDLLNDSKQTSVKFFDDSFIVDDINDISKFGKEYKSIVKPLINKLEKFIALHGDVWQHNTRSIDPNLSYCQAAAIRGHVRDCNKKVIAGNSSKEITTDDFYTMLISVEDCKGIRQPNLNRPGNPTPTFGFATVIERDNFLKYLNTDFARFCLAILKNNGNLAVGEMELIPWLDFTQAWDDEKLFSHFDIDQKTQDYIRSFLPDYYGIRKNTISTDKPVNSRLLSVFSKMNQN